MASKDVIRCAQSSTDTASLVIEPVEKITHERHDSRLVASDSFLQRVQQDPTAAQVGDCEHGQFFYIRETTHENGRVKKTSLRLASAPPREIRNGIPPAQEFVLQLL